MFIDLKPFTTNAKPTGRVLGKGSYGEVEEMRVGQKVVAGKKFRLSINDDGTIRKFSTELLTLAQLRHPNIVAFEGLPSSVELPQSMSTDGYGPFANYQSPYMSLDLHLSVLTCN